MNLRQLEHLLAVADSGSFSRAAEQQRAEDDSEDSYQGYREFRVGGQLHGSAYLVGVRRCVQPSGHHTALNTMQHSSRRYCLSEVRCASIAGLRTSMV